MASTSVPAITAPLRQSSHPGYRRASAITLARVQAVGPSSQRRHPTSAVYLPHPRLLYLQPGSQADPRRRSRGRRAVLAWLHSVHALARGGRAPAGAPGWSNGMVFLVEGASMAVIIVLVGVFLSVPRLAPRVPWLVGFLIGAAIAGLGTVTGGCVNPARQFGPAIFAGQFGFLPAYLLAPLVGAFVAPWLLCHFQHRKVLTHRLCGDPGADGSDDVRRDRLAGFA
jgi:hypothetical protein